MIEDLSQEAAQALLAKLTPREREVVERVAIGDARRDIATRLDVSVKTVDTHLQNIVEKFRLQPRGFARVWFVARVDKG